MMKIQYQELTIERIVDTAAFIRRVFDEFVSPDISPLGCQNFYRFIAPAEFQKRLGKESAAILALDNDIIAGMIEMRQSDHIALLFVDRAYQKQGIASELLRQAIVKSKDFNPDLHKITVNSSPYTVHIYEKMGFSATDTEQEKMASVSYRWQ